jgi:signal transduction histidine kinase
METVRARAVAVVVAIILDLLVWGGSVATTSGGSIPWWLPVAVTVVGQQSLWFVGSRPHLVLAAGSALALVSCVVPKWQPFTGLLVATYAVGTRPRGRHTLPVLAGLGAALLSHSYASARLTVEPVRSTATLLALWAALAAGAWAVGVRHRRTVDRAAAAGEHWSAQAREGVANERLRIARDLHDGVCGAVTAIQLQAAGACALGPTHPEATGPSLLAIQSSAERTLVELRRVLGDLRRDAVEDTGGSSISGPSLEEIPQLVGLARSAGLRVTLTQTVDAATRLDPGAEATVVRVVQEGLTNAVKHGPRGRCEVSVRVDPAGARVRVDSMGSRARSAHTPTAGSIGAEEAARPEGAAGIGLVGLAERAALVGGHLCWTAQGERFTLDLVVPAPAWAGR